MLSRQPAPHSESSSYADHADYPFYQYAEMDQYPCPHLDPVILSPMVPVPAFDNNTQVPGTTPYQPPPSLRSRSQSRGSSQSMSSRSNGNRINRTVADRPHRCSTCGKYFARRHTLKEHMKTHEGRGPLLKCKERGCDKEYGREADLNRHVRSVSKPQIPPGGLSKRDGLTSSQAHLAEKYPCPSCGKAFKRSDTLRR